MVFLGKPITSSDNTLNIEGSLDYATKLCNRKDYCYIQESSVLALLVDVDSVWPSVVVLTLQKSVCHQLILDRNDDEDLFAVYQKRFFWLSGQVDSVLVCIFYYENIDDYLQYFDYRNDI